MSEIMEEHYFLVAVTHQDENRQGTWYEAIKFEYSENMIPLLLNQDGGKWLYTKEEVEHFLSI